MIDIYLVTTYLTLRITGLRWDDRGEGVISAAIAVLVMAFLGAAMWVAFNEIFTTATEQVGNQVQQIGSGG